MQSKRKGLPVELLVHIFKASDCTIMNLLPSVCDEKGECSTLKQKEYEKRWINYSNNLLTSSSIVNVFVAKVFQKRWIWILEEGRKVKRIEFLMEKIARLKAENLRLTERYASLLEEDRRLNEKYARMKEERKIFLKRCKTDLDANSIAKRTRSHAQENGPVAKRTRSHYASTLSKMAKKRRKNELPIEDCSAFYLDLFK